METMITYQETVIHWLLLEWKTSHTDHGHDLNVSKWKKGYYPSGELGYVYHKSFAGLFEHFSETEILLFRWGRWNEINDQGQFKRGWALSDIEDCARVIVSVNR